MEKTEVGKMETQLAQWGAKLDELVAKAGTAAGLEAKTDSKKGIDELKAKYEVARSKLEELKAAGSEKGETPLKTGFEGAWNELEVAFKKLGKS